MTFLTDFGMIKQGDEIECFGDTQDKYGDTESFSFTFKSESSDKEKALNVFLNNPNNNLDEELISLLKAR